MSNLIVYIHHEGEAGPSAMLHDDFCFNAMEGKGHSSTGLEGVVSNEIWVDTVSVEAQGLSCCPNDGYHAL